MIMTKKYFRWVVFAMCVAWLMSLFGCGEGKPQMLDGPGMEYQSPWVAFALTRTDSNAQYNFWFEVTETDEGAVVTGSCRDEDGTDYETETGILISTEDLWQLRWMHLDQLPEENSGPDDLPQPLDMESVKLALTLSDGTVEKKNISSDLSIEIYKLLLPYLKNN